MEILSTLVVGKIRIDLGLYNDLDSPFLKN